MGTEDRNWWKDKQNEFERRKLNDSILCCKYCEGLTVNALTLICSSCGKNNSQFYSNRNPKNGHPPACNCVDCTNRRLGKA
jgi:hypothetical protein